MRRVALLSLGLASLLYAKPSVKLDPIIESFVPDYRIHVNATLSDTTPNVVRTYFKSSDSANYMFVPMSCEADKCQSILPAVSKETASIDYLVLFVDNDKVYKTQTFRATALNETNIPLYQSQKAKTKISVKTEIEKKPTKIRGFNDSYTIDTVESSTRFGTVAGLYGAGASTTALVSGGTVVATSATISTTTLVVGGAVAAGGIGALIAGGGGGDSSSTTDTTDNTQSLETTVELEGSWFFTGEMQNYNTNYTLTYNYLKSYICSDYVVQAENISNYQALACNETCSDVSDDQALYEQIIRSEEGSACQYRTGTYTTEFGTMSVYENEIKETSSDGMHTVVRSKVD